MSEPYCLAMVLCDQIYHDRSTHKFTILGTFNNITAMSFPTDVPMAVYAAVTDGMGPTTLALQIVRASAEPIDATNAEPDEDRVFHRFMELDFDSPLMVLEFSAQFMLRIPGPGQYHCELWASKSLLMSRRLAATRFEGGPTPPHAEEHS